MTKDIALADPFGALLAPSRHGRQTGLPGIEIGHHRHGSMVEVAGYGEVGRDLRTLVERETGLTLPDLPGAGMVKGAMAAFQHAPDRIFVTSGKPGLAGALTAAIDPALGAVIDQSHGKIALHCAGPGVARMLQKLVAIDCDPSAFRIGHGVATAHHQIFLLIQRAGTQRFRLFVPRSYARSFLSMVIDAGLEDGIEIVEDTTRL